MALMFATFGMLVISSLLSILQKGCFKTALSRETKEEEKLNVIAPPPITERNPSRVSLHPPRLPELAVMSGRYA
ncbi:hypothetical protein E8E11_005537 [Didymella keratinophila]|nr:hypothetical protein E8E11_005537 [Didymella keratinophila]